MSTLGWRDSLVGGINDPFTLTTSPTDLTSHFNLRHYQVNGSYTDGSEMPHVWPLQSSNDSPPPEDDTKLQLYNLTEEDTGLYSCRVTNQYGGAVATGSITVTQLDTVLNTGGIVSSATVLPVK